MFLHLSVILFPGGTSASGSQECTPPRQTPPEQIPLRQDIPQADTLPGQTPPGQTPPQTDTIKTATAVEIMHPTGMHSCNKKVNL